jgi:alpha-galactosidase
MNRFFSCLVLGLLLVPEAAEAKPLQVYVLAGQSNMQGHAQVRTFAHLGMDEATRPMLERMQNPDGTPRVCERVWISSIGCGKDDAAEQTGKLTAGFGASQGGPKIGPEFTFGLFLERNVDAPILLIKTAWGGKSLHTDFRPPGAGPFVFRETQLAALAKQGKDLAAVRAEKEAATGAYYRRMIGHVKAVLADPGRIVPDYDPSQGYELAGFVWFQGWNDMVDGGVYPDRDRPGGYDAYAETLAHFIRDVRKDLEAPRLPFVIGVLGVGGPTSEYGPEEQRYRAIHQHFRDAMAAPAALPEFQGTVAAVLTERYWDRELKAARKRAEDIKRRVQAEAKQAGLKPDQERAALQQALAQELAERDRRVLDAGVSNFEFHYLGSAKILGGIGQGFAEAMVDLQNLNPSPR